MLLKEIKMDKKIIKVKKVIMNRNNKNLNLKNKKMIENI